MLTRPLLPAAALLACALAAAPALAADYGDPLPYEARPVHGPRFVAEPPVGAPRPPCFCRPRPEALAYPPPPRRSPVTVETYARPTPYGGWASGTRTTGYGPDGPVSTGTTSVTTVDPYTGAVYSRQTSW